MSGSKVMVSARGAVPRAGRLSRPTGFAIATAVLVLFQAASSAPAPLYVVYQRMWGFSSATLTLIFAIFVFALLSSVLVFGSLSDHIGRRPVLAASVALEAVALALFLTAGDVTMLLAARVVQGVATGMVLPALAATICALVPIIVASWALGGLYLSLGPSAAMSVFGIASHFVGGLVVTLLCGTGAVAAVALRNSAAVAVLRIAAGMLAAGTALAAGQAAVVVGLRTAVVTYSAVLILTGLAALAIHESRRAKLS